MTRVGIYLGSQTDTPENIEEVLRAWGEYLVNYDVETFGSVALPESVAEAYTHLEFADYSCRTPLHKLRTAYRHCTEYIGRRSPDVLIQLWTYTTHGPGVVLAGKHKGIPTIVRFTGDLFREYRGYSSPSKWAVYLLNNGIGRLPLRLADRIIALGPQTVDIVTRHGANEGEIVLLPPPKPDTGQFHPVDDKRVHRERLGLPPDRPVALYVGRLTEQKGLPFLTDVITTVRAGSEYTFLVVGEGPYHDKIAQCFPENDVILAGHVPHDRIDTYYKAADVYLHPSPYEGLPLVVLEALACDVPVVARQAGDIGFVTDNIVQSPDQMADILSRKGWVPGWQNEDYFEPGYQQQILTDTINEVVR